MDELIVVFYSCLMALCLGIIVGWRISRLLGKPVEKIVYSPIPQVRRGKGGRFEKIPDA